MPIRIDQPKPAMGSHAAESEPVGSRGLRHWSVAMKRVLHQPVGHTANALQNVYARSP
jgi:hypothetical protein